MAQMGETVHATTVAHFSPDKAVQESGNEKATVEKSSHEILPGICSKACGKPQGQLKKKLLGSDETQIELFAHQTRH